MLLRYLRDETSWDETRIHSTVSGWSRQATALRNLGEMWAPPCAVPCRAVWLAPKSNFSWRLSSSSITDHPNGNNNNCDKERWKKSCFFFLFCFYNNFVHRHDAHTLTRTICIFITRFASRRRRLRQRLRRWRWRRQRRRRWLRLRRFLLWCHLAAVLLTSF